MTRRAALVLTTGLITAVALALAGPAAAANVGGPDVSGRWNSASLRSDDVGYWLKVGPAATPGTYPTLARMRFQDGRSGPVIRGTLTVDGQDLRLRLPRGTVRGSLGQDGSMYFPRCARVLAHVAAAEADQMCLFQDLPR